MIAAGPTDEGPARTNLRDFLRERFVGTGDAWTAVILLGLMAVFAVISPPNTFLTFSNIRNLALDTSEILILAAGTTFVLIAAGIDLSIGSIVVFASVVSAKVMVDLTGNPFVSTTLEGGQAFYVIGAGVVAALLSGLLWGFVNGFLTMRAHIPPFIVTLGTFGMALGLAQLITGGLNVPNTPTQLQSDFANGSLVGLIPWPVIVAATIVGILWITLSHTQFGLRTYAIGSNVEAVRRAGVNVTRHMVAIYALMGLLCGVVAFLDVSRFGAGLIGGQTQTNLAAIAAVVIGGTSLFGGRGHMAGTVAGAFIPAVLLNGLVLIAIQPFWQKIFVGAILVAAVYIDQVRRSRLEQG